MKAIWEISQVQQFYTLPFIKLISKASAIHLEHHAADEMELCSLLSIKTGACPEDCAYCPQSVHYNTGLEREKLWALADVVSRAEQAKALGAKRFCMGAAWRNPSEKNLSRVIEMIKAVKEIGLETCVTLGMLKQSQVKALEEAGLDYYNHNLDTSPDYYSKIITTRTYADRLETLNYVEESNIHTCCGGIIGMGESREDRIALLAQLANLPNPPRSVPINKLMSIPGTPLEKAPEIDNIEFVRTIAVARILMPQSIIRLSAGRETMSEEMQALCFTAVANSMWLGDKLLTTKNPSADKDMHLLNKLGYKIPLYAE
jgi:biotin synthase